ncbi:MAG: MOSC domain-containing protein [Anaerolineales bacterium]|nr:MOSC domain-containing protein [Anaerolineales bacterium]
MPHLASIVYSPADGTPEPSGHYRRVPLEQAALTVEGGIQGDRKGRNPERQLNVMAAQTLAVLAGQDFQTGPGQMGEQLIVSGLDLDGLPAGTRVQIGPAAVIELIKPRTGCSRFEHIQGKPASDAAGRMGFMAAVVSAGDIRVGDPVSVQVSQPA